jgi:DNA-binding CsgD family transcriptional regulator
VNRTLPTKKSVPEAHSTPAVPVEAQKTSPTPPEPAMPETTPRIPRPASLSPREEEVLALLAQGCTYRIIARRMGLSPHTVDTYARRLRGKTGSVNRTQLAHLAFRMGYGPDY